jgi:hypothetical protein
MRLLSVCFPTYGRDNGLHLNGHGDRVVLAPDEFHRQLLMVGWQVDVVGLTPRTTLRLFRSELSLKVPDEVDFNDYDLCWHMFRDPTQPEVLNWLREFHPNHLATPVINRAERLASHQKNHYLPILHRYGIGPKILLSAPQSTSWIVSSSELVSEDLAWIDTYAYNNNRGDYPSRGSERIVTEYIDNAVGGRRSIVRFGYAFGQGFSGFRYFKAVSVPTFKTGEADSHQPYVVPQALRPRITAAMNELGCDVCHIEAIPLGDRLYVIDVNPYPTASGKTLSQITSSLIEVLTTRFGPGRPC